MVLRRTIVAAGSALLATGVMAVASAASLPRYDVQAQCKEVASLGGASSATLENSCVDMEQAAYNALKTVWDSVPVGVQKQCDRVAAAGGGGSYSLLQSCIQMESDAAAAPRKFKY